MSYKTCALVGFIIAALDVAIATSGTSNHPGVFYGLATLLFGTGLSCLAQDLKGGYDG